MGAEGALLFARYAYPPNELGYCGPSGASRMLAPEAVAEIEERARRFEGAWSYLEALAAAADVSDPLDVRVVEAYWVGNDLLDRLDSRDLLRRLLDRFRDQHGGTWREAGDRARAHHSFHVFEVYPWAGLLTSAAPVTAVSVLDQCRVRTGVVLEVGAQVATVSSRPLTWDGTGMVLDEPQQQTVRWAVDGASLIERPRPGERVSLHWDWVCDVLSTEQARRVESLERRQLGALGLTRPPSSTLES
jgi:hypothetical protein